MVISKVWHSLKSKTIPKCHLGILSNTRYALIKLTCEQCMNMSESCLNKCSIATIGHTNTNRSNGIEPNQEIEKNFTKFKVSQPFFKITQFK